MMKVATFFLILFLGMNLFVDAKPNLFLDEAVHVKDLKLEEYEKDKSAEAIILLDKGDSRFVKRANRYVIQFDRYRKIKIFKNAGIKYAQVSIPLYKGDMQTETITEISAATYNLENGEIKKTELNTAENAFEEKLNENWILKKIAFPQVREGSVLEIRYSIESPFIFNLIDWEFQSDIPTVYSEYTVRMIALYQYEYVTQSIAKFDVFENYEDKSFGRNFGFAKQAYSAGVNEYHDVVYRFGLNDVPAFGNEVFITSRKDVIKKIDFQLCSYYSFRNNGYVDFITTWEKLIDNLSKNENLGKFISKSEKLAKKEIESKIMEMPNGVDKYNAIVNYVKDNYAYNNKKDMYAYKKIKEFITQKEGNSASLNLFMIGALKSAGFDTHPVILSTREHGRIYKKFPFEHSFNYVIALTKIGDEYYMSDATDHFCPSDKLPSYCINDEGLILDKGDVKWVNLSNNVPSSVAITFHHSFNVNLDNEVIDVRLKLTNYDALYFRRNFNDEKEDMLKALNIDGVEDESIVSENFKDITKSYGLKFKANIDLKQVEDKIFIAPFLEVPLAKNPLTHNVRNYPVDMVYPKQRTYLAEISIPDGYKIEYLPESFKINNEIFSLNFMTNQQDDKITIAGSYAFVKAKYDVAYYKKLKYYFNQIVRCFNDEVILTKI